MSSLQKAGEKTSLNLYFQVHQPRRLRALSFFDIGKGLPVFDDELNGLIIRRIAKNCYQPSNEMFLDLIRRFPGTRLTFSVSGVALEQLAAYAPEVIASFRELASTGAVEFLGETYYHSLACVSDPDGFRLQVEQHRQAMEHYFGIRPSVFRNTELIYSDEVGRLVNSMGFKGIYVDGINKILKHRSADHLYEHVDAIGLRLFVRNYSLSDDIAFRFSNRKWKEWPLTPERFTRWLTERPSADRLISLGIDYETFGEHHKRQTGIFRFMKGVMTALGTSRRVTMVTPSEALANLPSKDRLSSPTFISWADKDRDLSAWLGNELQKDAFDNMSTLGRQIAASGDVVLKRTWDYLQTSDHFYYMSTKKSDDGNVHNYFSPYTSPYEAFMNYMNVLSELTWQLKRRKKSRAAARKKNPEANEHKLMVA